MNSTLDKICCVNDVCGITKFKGRSKVIVYVLRFWNMNRSNQKNIS